MHLELDISANADCKDIILEVYIDQTKIFQSTAQTQIQTVLYDLEEDSAEHELKLIMGGKNSNHTTVDTDGQITSDIFFTINRLMVGNAAI